MHVAMATNNIQSAYPSPPPPPYSWDQVHAVLCQLMDLDTTILNPTYNKLHLSVPVQQSMLQL